MIVGNTVFSLKVVLLLQKYWLIWTLKVIKGNIFKLEEVFVCDVFPGKNICEIWVLNNGRKE